MNRVINWIRNNKLFIVADAALVLFFPFLGHIPIDWEVPYFSFFVIIILVWLADRMYHKKKGVFVYHQKVFIIFVISFLLLTLSFVVSHNNINHSIITEENSSILVTKSVYYFALTNTGVEKNVNHLISTGKLPMITKIFSKIPYFSYFVASVDDNQYAPISYATTFGGPVVVWVESGVPMYYQRVLNEDNGEFKVVSTRMEWDGFLYHTISWSLFFSLLLLVYSFTAMLIRIIKKVFKKFSKIS